MERIAVRPRDDWTQTAETLGFDFHTMYGLPYWVESACYMFDLKEIEDELEGPTGELMEMCYALVDRAVADEEILRTLHVPEPWWHTVRESWLRRDKDLYARFDLSHDGDGPAKLLELNGDTPTALYESAFFQWVWLEEALDQNIIPDGSDQFNSLQEALIDAFAVIGRDTRRRLMFTCVVDNAEDRGTVQYLRDCAEQAGLATALIDIAEIGVDAAGRLTDLDDRVIEALFKLYPWEFLIEEEFGSHLQGPNAPVMIEPAWKMLLSNKGLLPWLWRLHPGHPNLLPAYFEGDPAAAELGPRHVVKPLFSREGANVRMVDPTLPGGGVAIDGPYGAEGRVIQACHPLPVFTGADGRPNHAVIGSWIVAGRPCGIGVREDDGPITINTSRFVPHLIRG